MTVEVRGMTPLIQVFDMPTSIRFYRDVLGFTVAESDRPGDDCDWVLLRIHDVELMLNTAYESDSRPPAPDPARIAAHRDTSFFFGCPDVDGTYERLRALGVEATAPKATHYGFKGFSVRDPDGFELCFHWPVG